MTKNAAANNAGRSCCQLTRGPDSPNHHAGLSITLPSPKCLDNQGDNCVIACKRRSPPVAQATGVPRTSSTPHSTTPRRPARNRSRRVPGDCFRQTERFQ